MDAHRAGVWMLLVVLLTGCASGPTVRLRTEKGARTYAPATWDRRVPVSALEFEEALARLVLEVPLTVRSPKVVRAVAVVDGVVEVTLASTAVTMATVGSPPPSSNTGGPGKWVQVNETMSDRARDYQAQVTGAPKGSAYRVKQGDEEVDFDGYDLVEDLLLEAKGPGYAKFIQDNMTLKEFYKGFDKVLAQAERQYLMARGMRVRCAKES
nr:restriction endonuclease fold toxin 5 domain-containing protein [Corallococcus carmarthensis]